MLVNISLRDHLEHLHLYFITFMVENTCVMQAMVFFFIWFLYIQVVITSLDIDDKLMIIGSHIQSKARFQILHPFYQLKCFFNSYINKKVSL